MRNVYIHPILLLNEINFWLPNVFHLMCLKTRNFINSSQNHIRYFFFLSFNNILVEQCGGNYMFCLEICWFQQNRHLADTFSFSILCLSNGSSSTPLTATSPKSARPLFLVPVGDVKVASNTPSKYLTKEVTGETSLHLRNIDHLSQCNSGVRAG